MADELVINRRLKDNYGMSALHPDKPKYRVVWSTGLTEKRFGEFNDFYGDIFVRSVKAIREVPKYPFDRDRWILERYVRAPNPELDHDGTDRYEAIWTFKGPDGEFLPLNYKAIEIIINILENPAKVNPVAVLEDMMQKKDEAELARDVDMLGDLMSSPYFQDLVE
jgi:hypothetical protein